MKKKASNKRSRKNTRSKATTRRLLVPVDFSDLSLRALRYAVELAKDAGGSLLIVHVVAADYGWLDIGREEYRDLDKALQKQAARELRALVEAVVPHNISTDLKVRIGRPAEEIVAVAAETKSDLIVLSTHGRTWLERYLLGSVAERVARLSGCPVLLLPPGKRPAKPDKTRPSILRSKSKRSTSV